MTGQSSPVHPIPTRGLACVCGEELEVVERVARGSALDLVCPRGCAYTPPPNLRPLVKAPRAAYPPAERICARCSQPIERVEGQRGRPASTHDECLSPTELAAKRAAAAKVLATYRARRLAGRPALLPMDDTPT